MRRRMMACTTSIGPGATNLVTAAALAHVNRLPVLLLPGDVFVSRAPDPVLQQVEDFQDGTVSANDCLRPVSRYFDRIVQSGAAAHRAAARARRADRSGAVRPGDARAAAGRADHGLRLSGSDCSRRTPSRFARRRRAPTSSPRARRCSLGPKRPLLVAGGGVLYGLRERRAARVRRAHGVPVAETQAGKGALAWDHPLQAGALGVTGSPAANALASEADVVHRRRHAPAGFHDRLAFAVRAGRSSSASTSTPSTRSSGAARAVCADARRRRSTRCRRRWAAGARKRRGTTRPASAANDWRADDRAHHRPARRRSCPTTAT